MTPRVIGHKCINCI